MLADEKGRADLGHDSDKGQLLPLATSDSPGGLHDDRSRSNAQRWRKVAVAALVVAAVVWQSLKLLPLDGRPRHRGHGHGRHRLNELQDPSEQRSVHGYIRKLYSSNILDAIHDSDELRSSRQRKHMSPHQVEAEFSKVPDPESARNASHSFTFQQHIAGTENDRLSALRVGQQWADLLGLGEQHIPVYDAGTKESRRALTGVRNGRQDDRRLGKGVKKRSVESDSWVRHGARPSVWVDTYYPMLNYPRSHSLKLIPATPDRATFVASLQEDVFSEDPTSGQGPMTFHGYAKNGSATGQLVYAGRGTKEEFDELQAAGVDFTGKVVIVQYGGCFRGLKVKAAAEAGASAVLIYTDPIEDGEVTAERGIDTYPKGPARNPSSVQRGSVQFLSVFPGDPLTPFKPAYKDAKRLPEDDPDLNIPSIPSIPISYRDALPFLKSLKGKGMKREGKDGRKEGGLEYLGVEYWTGPGDDTVELTNEMDNKVIPIWNTYALIPGHIEDEVVVIGNHNDAWTFGAADPNSGTAAVHEVVKAFGALGRKGWKPLRTILVASWDAEEYGLVGSTEFGEDFSQWLKDHVVAYLNIDVGAAGSYYGLNASPSLADLLRNVSAAVEDPEQPGRSLLDRAAAEEQNTLSEQQHAQTLGAMTQGVGKDLKIGALGSGSDFTVMLQHLGLASANVGFSRKSTDPVYMYHSSYDSAAWMDRFGDTNFKRHDAIARVLGLTALRLADSIILPINVTAYAYELETYAAKVPALASFLSESDKRSLDLDSLNKAVASVQRAAHSLDNEIASVRAAVLKLAHGKQRGHCRRKLWQLVKRVRSINRRLKGFEGTFIDEKGLPGRPWYRSLVVAPGRNLGYGATTLPALTESLTLDKDVTAARHEVKRLVKAFAKTEKLLRQQ